MEIALWMVLVGIAVVFVLVSDFLLTRALFATRVLQWAKHHKGVIGPEALWVWRIAFVLTLGIGFGEFRKLGNPLLVTTYTSQVYAGLAVLLLGLLVWLTAMHARKQYLWFIQVLAPKEVLPVFSMNGIYAQVRNPRELGLLLVLAGLAMTFTLSFTLAFVGILFLATAFRASSRDRILMEKHGKAYIDYMRTSKKLIPYIY